MALDCQQNWNIMMADNVEKVLSQSRKVDTSVDCRIPTTFPRYSDDSADGQKQEQKSRRWTTEPIYLPDEIIIQILEYLAHTRESQRTLASVCRLSHQWYSAAVPFLYERPNLYGKNFEPFCRAICPSINLHVRKSPLSRLVRVLDMGGLVHQGSKSVTARLLGRTKEGLEEFRAPQASFAVNCLPALAKCANLGSLDLSLVSESPPLPDLFRTISHLEKLKTFRLPRSSGFGVHTNPHSILWPPNLETLALSGGIDAHFLHGVVAFPQTVRHIVIEHCPLAKGFAVSHLLRTAVRPLRNLESVTIKHLPRLSAHALDDILFLLPQIRKLSISVDYITPAIFDEGHFHQFKDPHLPSLSGPSDPVAQDPSAPLRHENLHTLELTNSGNPNVEDKISPIDVMIALDEGTLPRLRVVRAQRTLYWQSNSTSADSEALADALIEQSKKDWELRVGEYEAMERQEYEMHERDRGKKVGVWTFD